MNYGSWLVYNIMRKYKQIINLGTIYYVLIKSKPIRIAGLRLAPVGHHDQNKCAFY